jgi:hypothetical protein
MLCKINVLKEDSGRNRNCECETIQDLCLTKHRDLSIELVVFIGQ